MTVSQTGACPLCPYRVPHLSVAQLTNTLFVVVSLQTYGAKVDQIRADFGATASLDELEKALQSKKYKLVTVTHVDTSTGVFPRTKNLSIFGTLLLTPIFQAVLSNPKAVAAVVKKVSPDTLVILDAVCAVASEEIRMEDWGIDVVMSASQKGLGAPPGLSVIIASQKAIKVRLFISLVRLEGLAELWISLGVRDEVNPYCRVLCQLEKVSIPTIMLFYNIFTQLLRILLDGCRL